MSALAKEFLENGLELHGFEWFLPVTELKRSTTEHERALVAKLRQYPVQFRDLHWYRD
jgi:hypothetical protein